ncbi:AMP-binding protein [Natronomonas marina]|uniref:AMP-binding protein n=1 Tax=Natronomonas marina TaxID=2961939 RepID=UPI0020C9B625|nr:AMP-binding protein [Natronomonas marina]
MDRAGNRTTHDIWKDRQKLTPDKEFLVFEDADGETSRFTYAELNDGINRTANALRDELGIGEGDKVTIHLTNSPEYLLTWFGAMRAGAVVVHSNANHTAGEVNYTIDNSDSVAAITQPGFEAVVDEAAEGTAVDTKILVRTDEAEGDKHVFDDLIDGASTDPPDVDLRADDTAQIMFTSGTTSAPKGVVHTHANLVNASMRIGQSAHARPDDRNLTALPLFHVNGQIVSLLSMLGVGGSLVLLETYDTGTYMGKVREYEATLTSLIGTQVRALLMTPEQPADGSNDLREVFFAINITEDEKETFVERFDVSLMNGYGLTETVTGVTMTPPYSDRRYPSIGVPQSERVIHLVDDDGNEVPDGERGEIAVEGVRGRTIFKEYYQMPEKTEEAFTDEGWFLTGDIGRFDELGYVYFVDRKKNIIKTRGENVSESQVENALEEHPKIGEVAVVGAPHEVYDEVVKAYVLPADPELTPEEVVEYAEENLAEFKVPEEVEFVEEFPRTSIGKVEKVTLREQEGAE